MVRRFLIALAILSFGCSADDPASTDETLDDEVEITTTPRPSLGQLEVIVQQVNAIYAGPSNIENELVATCGDLLAGVTGDELTGRTIYRWSGGTRSDPTIEQANAIVAAVAASEWCAP